MNDQLPLMLSDQPGPETSLKERAERFCTHPPHRQAPYAGRNWGGPLHSLCSYQGKLKPAIAHFLVDWFTEPGDTVVDPMAGVGTIPLEARRLGRIGIGNDLSPLAYSVTSAKTEPLAEDALAAALTDLASAMASSSDLEELRRATDVTWGLNKPIEQYFHPETLREVLAARSFFLKSPATPEMNLLRASTMHVLHGNRPYALSRRSHPVTPFAPTGEFEYRSLLEKVQARLERVVPQLLTLNTSAPPGAAMYGDFRNMTLEGADAVITSPPFARSLRFWSSNWMRLWFAGWDPADFKVEPDRYLETEQKAGYEPYADFLSVCARMLKKGGVLVLHLGETPKENMAAMIGPMLEPTFQKVHVGRECVVDTESHGLSDKGATVAHWYLFATRR